MLVPTARINAAPATTAVFALVQAMIFKAPWMRVKVELSHTLQTALPSNRHARCRFTFSTTSNATGPWKSGGGPSQSKTRSVNLRLANGAQRFEVRQPSGAWGTEALHFLEHQQFNQGECGLAFHGWPGAATGLRPARRRQNWISNAVKAPTPNRTATPTTALKSRERGTVVTEKSSNRPVPELQRLP